MKRLLSWRVSSDATARRCAWGAGFLLLAACTTLVLKMLPEFGVWSSIGLIGSVALAWVVLGAQLPKAVRA
jgi:hypothetical protein